MLIEFRVQNHRSIGQEQVITMEAMKRLGDEDDPRPRKVKGYDKQLLPVAALYGANASGKSNFLAAMRFMRDAVEHSFRNWSPDEVIDREPFAWGEFRTQPSLYEISMLIDGVRYQYGFELNDERILEEWLFSWPKNYKKVLYSRNLDKYKFSKTGFEGDYDVIARNTRQNSLFLSTSAQFNHTGLKPVLQWFRRFTMIRVGSAFEQNAKTLSPFKVLPLLLQNDKQDKERLNLMRAMGFDESMILQCREMIEKADFGIHDLRVVEKQSIVGDSFEKKPQLEFKHDEQDDSAWIPLRDESMGTKSMIILSPLFFRALHYGDPVVVDELESNLHPLLALEIIGSFNNPKSNPKNAQLIFSTHDTNLLSPLLDETPLRRDQIWLADKKTTGQTEICPLTDFNARKEENIERGYLLGRYGAIPFVHELLSSSPEHDNVSRKASTEEGQK